MKKSNVIYASFLLTFSLSAGKMYAQQGFGTATPNKASVIEMSSTTRGLLIPRVALTSTTNFAPIKGAASSASNSLMVFNTNTVADVTPGYYYWSQPVATAAGAWVRLITNADVLATQKTTILSNGINTTIPTPTVSGNVTNYQVDVATATNTGNLGVVKQAANNPSVNINANGELSVNLANATGKGNLSATNGDTSITVNNGANATLINTDIKVSDLGITSSKLAATSVTAAKLNNDVAGNGLTQTPGGALQVNANNGLTVDADADAVQLGGKLLKNTTIDAGTNTLTFLGSGAGSKFIVNKTTPGTGYALQVQDGTQGNGKVLTSDANGNASWLPLPDYASNIAVTAPILNTGTTTAPNIGIDRKNIVTGNSVSGATAPLTLDVGATNAVVGNANATLTVNNTAPLWNANQLQGRSVATTAPANGQVLQYNGTNWLPNSLPADISIYTNDGTLTGNRTVTQGANTLTFSSTAIGGTKFVSDGTASNQKSALQIVDGRQEEGKYLMSDTSGNATWQMVNIKAVPGDFSTVSRSLSATTTSVYTGASITLPPGKWMIHLGSTVGTVGNTRIPADGQLWVAFWISDSNTTNLSETTANYTADHINTYSGRRAAAGSINSGAFKAFVSGSYAVWNNSNLSKTYHIHMVQNRENISTSYNASNAFYYIPATGGGQPGGVWERYIYALPIQ